jgi:hypothetical protein
MKEVVFIFCVVNFTLFSPFILQHITQIKSFNESYSNVMIVHFQIDFVTDDSIVNQWLKVWLMISMPLLKV